MSPYSVSGYEKAKVGSAPTPFLDESNDPLSVIADEGPLAKARDQGGTEVEGAKLSKIACKVLMKIMYITRFARPDLLRAVGAL